MRVLFVYTDINVRGGALSYQFGIGQLSAVLRRHGHETRLHYMFGSMDLDGLRACVAEYKPDVVGFTLVYPQYRFVKQAIETLRPWSAFTICGGAHTSVMPTCLEDIQGLNAICIGEGEYPMLELVDTLAAGGSPDHIPSLWVKHADGTIVRNPTRPFIEDLNTLPFYDREFCDYQAIIDSDFGVATFQFGRGCPFSCTYCSNHIIRDAQEGHYVRFRSVEGALEEVRQVVRRFKVKSLYFNDDTFMVKKSFFEGFCERYPKEFAYPFLVNARPEQIDEDVCRRLKAAGCTRVTMGVEHGDEQFRAQVLGRRMSNETIINAFDLCHKYGFKTKAHNLVGLPHETPAIHAKTVELNARIMPDSFNLHIFEPYPGTTLGDICVKENLIDASRLKAEFVGQTDTVLHLPGFPRAEILRNFRLFGYRIYRRRSPLKAFIYYAYYSRYGEFLIRALQPMKRILRRLAMGV